MIIQKYVDIIKDKDFNVVQQYLEGLLLISNREGTEVEEEEFYDRVETC